MKQLIIRLSILAMIGASAWALPDENAALIDRSQTGWFVKATKAIAAVGTNALPSLIKLQAQQGNGSDATRLFVAAGFEALGRDASPAIPDLIRSLRSPSPAVRSLAERCLRAIGQSASNAAPMLVTALKDPDSEVRLWAAMAFWSIPGNPDKVVPSLAGYFRGPHPDSNRGEYERAAALTALKFYAQFSPTARSQLDSLTNFPLLSYHGRSSADWNSDKAEREAQDDLAAGMIKIYMSGTRAAGAAGLGDEWHWVGLWLPNADAGIGCVIRGSEERALRQAQYEYGSRYNRYVVEHLFR